MRRLVVVLMSVVSLVLAAPVAATGQTATPKLPNSMAAIGDSMTQAADVCCWYGDHPANSWSTGGASWDGVNSHYERLRALNPAIAGRNYNDAVSGAKMASGPAEAQRAVSQRAQYVTLLLGANDLCTSTPASMTAVDTFREQLHQTLQVLMTGLPQNAHVFVASIPDVYQLWQIYHTDWAARLVWDVADICQSLLAPNRTEYQRQLVRQRNIAFNTVLAQECAAYTRCQFDNNAVFDFQFTRSHVSRLDYFHPSLAGQAALAGVTWQHSWWG
jgi:lysophospholipase L1-like esterase